MGLVDLSLLGWDLFLLGVFFLMGIGSLFSFGIMRLFQQQMRQGIVFLVLTVISTVVFVVILNVKYL